MDRIKKPKRATTPKPTDQVSPFMNPGIILDAANPMEVNPFPQRRTMSRIRMVSRRRAVPRPIMGSQRFFEVTSHLAASTKQIAPRHIIRLFILTFFASNVFALNTLSRTA